MPPKRKAATIALTDDAPPAKVANTAKAKKGPASKRAPTKAALAKAAAAASVPHERPLVSRQQCFVPCSHGTNYQFFFFFLFASLCVARGCLGDGLGKKDSWMAGVCCCCFVVFVWFFPFALFLLSSFTLSLSLPPSFSFSASSPHNRHHTTQQP